MRPFAYLLFAGAIANALASKDRDIETALMAYEAKDYESATQALAAAVQRRGDRPEIALNQGLVRMALEDKEGSRKAFERATESPEADLRASAWFELGNLAFDEESWDLAIEHYIACLSDAPTHEDAKWNLELALARKEQQEKEQEKDKDNQDKKDEQDQEDKQDEDKQDDEQDQDDENKDEDKEDEEKQDEEKQDEEKQEDEGASSSTGEDPKDQEQDASTSTGQDQDQPSGENQDDSTQKEDQSSTAPPNDPPEPEPGQQPPPPQGEPKSNLDRALEDLDRADPFMFGVPKRTRRPVKEDW